MSELVVRGVETEAELLEAHHLVARTQQFEREKALVWLATAGRAWPGFEWGAVRIALHEGRIVGALRVIDVPLRIGQARLHAGGIGWVSTDKHKRGQGICAALMADAHDYMQQKGFELSLLFGIPNLYQRFGYISAIPERSVRIQLADLPHELVGSCTHRMFHEEDVPAILEIYDRSERDASCSVVRNDEWILAQALSTDPKTSYWPDWPGTYIFLDEHEEVVGWLTPQRSEGELHIKELGARDESVCEDLLVMAKVLAHRAHADRIRFHVPPSHLFARYLEQFDSIHETHFFRNREGMVKLLDFDRVVQAMLPEWAHRLQSCCRHVRVNVSVRVGKRFVRLKAIEGRMEVDHAVDSEDLSLLATQFVLLMTGSRRPEDVIGSNWQSLDEEQRNLLRLIFARREPNLWPIDHF